MTEDQVPASRQRSMRATGLIAALTALAAVVVPPIASALRNPAMTQSGSGNVMVGRDVNIIANFAERWVDGVKVMAGRPSHGGELAQDDLLSGGAPGAGMPRSQGEARIGALAVRFERIDIGPRPGSGPDAALQATLGMEITNTGSAPLRLAVVPQWPTLQVDGGVLFGIRPHGVSGLQIFGSDNVAACERATQNFSLLRPGQTFTASMVFDTDLRGRKLPDVRAGRLSGMLMVYSEADKSCALEPFTVSRLAAAVYR
ncbi:MAG: hypothetical protein QM742_00145 [Aquabacterium sp.]